ncbi:hypothetical protein [uncultured Clostridium sp.]|uniref:hypothetical protein n=1 Tax=uncultured Clostridium sp. TaxID=59620 RepID=UPI0028EB5C94|nr:hypothetical protein [uncultured Clostridium sp.]
MDRSEIEKTIKAYYENGIVTRKDVGSIDSNPGSRELFKALKDDLEKNGYEDKPMLIQVGLEHYFDYSNVIYNQSMYSYDEAKDFMMKYVLKK